MKVFHRHMAVQVAAQMTQTLQQHLQISRAKLHQQSSPHSVENRHIQYHQETPNDDLVPTTSYMELPINETPDLEELEDFAQAFRERRIQLGFTQANVGIAMGKQYGRHFSHPTVSRFEALNLSYKNVCKLKPMLQKWIESMDNSLNNPCATTNLTTSSRRRITRTQIGAWKRVELTRAFIENPKPNSLHMIILAQKLGMRVEVVQVWFRNQRYKEKQANLPRRRCMFASRRQSQGSAGGPLSRSFSSHRIIQID